jgi:hypothetical protein
MISCSPRRRSPPRPLRLDAAAQRIHEVHDLRWLTLGWSFDLLTGLLLLQQILEGLFVAVLEPFRLESDRLAEKV